jgi:hypothetical protein
VGGVLVGADGNPRDRIDAISKAGGGEEAGPEGTKEGHGLVNRDSAGWHLIETRREDAGRIAGEGETP